MDKQEKDMPKKEEGDVEQGSSLCPKCGNVMIEEDGEKVCSHCIDDIDFFGEDEDIDEIISKEEK